MFPAMLTALLLWQPDSLAIPCVWASLIHEGGHLLAMLVLSVPPQDFSLGIFGARMHIDGGRISYGKNILVSLCGPLVNVLTAAVLLLCHRPVPALVNVLLAGVNLLPAIGLDGGEILRSGLCWSGLERAASAVGRLASVVVLLPVAVIGFYTMLAYTGNGSLLVLCVYLSVLIFFADKNQKTLDKCRVGWYNRCDE